VSQNSGIRAVALPALGDLAGSRAAQIAHLAAERLTYPPDSNDIPSLYIQRRARRKSAVNRQSLSRNPGRILGCKEQHGGCNVLRLAQPAQRM
jgi:hypothetical protein